MTSSSPTPPQPPGPTTTPWRPHGIIAPVLIGTLVTAIGAARVRDESYWMDETVSAAVVRRTFGGLSRVLYDQEAGMQPYYVGLWTWSQLFGSDAGLRMFSVVGGAATAVLLLVLARHWYGPRVAYVAVALLVTNPFFLRYLTEVRAYSWLMFLAVATAWAFDAARREPTLVRFAVLGCVAGLGIAIHLLFVVLVAILLATSFLLREFGPAHRRRIPVAAVTAGLMILPAVPALVQRGNQLDWLLPQTFSVMRQQGIEFYGGGALALLLVAGLLGATLAILGRREPFWPTVSVVAVATLLPLTIFVGSAVKPLFVARYLTPAFPFLVMAAAVGIEELLSRLFPPKRVALASALLVAGLSVGFVARRPLTDDSRGLGTREAIAFIESERQSGDLVVLDHFPLTVLHYLGYRPDIDPGATRSADDTLYSTRPPISSYVSQTLDSPTIFLVHWDPKRLESGVNDLLIGRELRTARQFGDTTVYVLDRT